MDRTGSCRLMCSESQKLQAKSKSDWSDAIRTDYVQVKMMRNGAGLQSAYLSVRY